MTTQIESIALSDEALDIVAGGNALTDVIKTGVHYAAKGLGHLHDVNSFDSKSNWADKYAGFADRITTKIFG